MHLSFFCDERSCSKPWAIETRFSRVDFRDVAEVAAVAITKDRHIYGTYELCADGHLNRQEVAELMGDVLGRKIQAGRLDLNSEPKAGNPMMDRWPRLSRCSIGTTSMHYLAMV